jgi:sec-independent protein translocase protein TatC
MSEADRTEREGEGTLLSHLVELRSRLLRMVVAVLLVFVCLAPFADQIFTLAADPLMARLPEGTSMIATQVASPFLTPFKLALAVAVFLTVPYLLYQAWAFIAPGLYKQERRLVLPLMSSSIVLFYSGVAFAYYVVFPLMFGFFTAAAPTGVTVMTDIAAYLDFVLALFFAFGIAFEVPVATVLAVWAGFTTPAKLAAKRPYVLLGAFVAGMLLTPPDIISQTLLAVPVYILFEGGIVMARIMVPGHREVEAQQSEHG